MLQPGVMTAGRSLRPPANMPRRCRSNKEAISPAFDDIRARFEQQDTEIRQLQAQLAGAQQGTPATPAALLIRCKAMQPAKPAEDVKSAPQSAPGRQRPERQGQFQRRFVPLA